jgi:hypothetical protein
MNWTRCLKCGTRCDFDWSRCCLACKARLDEPVSRNESLPSRVEREAELDRRISRLGLATIIALSIVGIAFLWSSWMNDNGFPAFLSLLALAAVGWGLSAALSKAPEGKGFMKGCLVCLLVLAAVVAGLFLLIFQMCGAGQGFSFGH